MIAESIKPVFHQQRKESSLGYLLYLMSIGKATESVYLKIKRFLGLGNDSVFDSLLLKLSVHRARLPGKVLSFMSCPFTPSLQTGLAGHLPVTWNILVSCIASPGC